MSGIQIKNFEALNVRVQQLQGSLETSTEFGALRHDIIKLKNSLKDTELHPNARRKFTDWLTKIFYEVNAREKEFIFSTASRIHDKLAELEKDPFQSFDMNTLRTECDRIGGWCNKNREILRKKPGKSHATDGDELDNLENNLNNLKNRLNRVQDKRTSHFRDQTEKFETRLAGFEVEIADLDRETVDKSFKRIFEGLKGLQKEIKAFPRKKSQRYWDRISELFKQLKGIKKESYDAGRQLESQENQRRFDGVLDGIEDFLDVEKIDNAGLSRIRGELFNTAWNPLKERENEKGPFKIFLIRQHRDSLFTRMRSLLEQIDDRREGISAYKEECRKNSLEMKSELEKLYDEWQKYHDEHTEGTSMSKGQLLRAVGGLTQKIKTCHRQLKTGHFFPRDRREISAALNERWADIDNLIQKIKEPEWSFEWLDDMIRKNDKLDGVILQVIEQVPSAS